MFDSVLGRGTQPSRVFFRGAIVSVSVHVAVLGLGVYVSMHKPAEIVKQITPPLVLLQPSLPPPRPPSFTPTPTQRPAPAPAERAKKSPIIMDTDKEPPEDKEPQPSPGPSATGDPNPASTCGGVGQPACAPACGAMGQPACGPACGGTGQPACAPPCGGAGQPCAPEGGGVTVLPFGPGMTYPTLLEGEKVPTPSREALMAKVEGLILASCTITTSGSVAHCRIVKGLPYMDEVILSNLEARKYTPIMYQGRAVAVEYKFPFRIVAP